MKLKNRKKGSRSTGNRRTDSPHPFHSPHSSHSPTHPNHPLIPIIPLIPLIPEYRKLKYTRTGNMKT